jgi:hypothetical protein
MDNVDMLLESLRALTTQVGAFLPRLALAIAVLIAGWLVAKLARFAVTRGLRAINFNVLTERAGIDGFLQQGGLRSDTSGILALLVYWVAILAAFLIAFDSVGLTYIVDLLGRVVLFVPRVIVALLIVTFGAYFARFVANAVITYCKNVGIQDAPLLGTLAQYGVMAFVVLIALEQVAVGGDIIRESFLVILAGIVLALALAFGLGGKDWAADRLERWWPRQKHEREDR